MKGAGDPGYRRWCIVSHQFADQRTDPLFATGGPGNLCIFGDKLDIVAASASWATGEYNIGLFLDFRGPSALIQRQIDDVPNRFTDPSLATNQGVGRCDDIKALRSRRGIWRAFRGDFYGLFDRKVNN